MQNLLNITAYSLLIRFLFRLSIVRTVFLSRSLSLCIKSPICDVSSDIGHHQPKIKKQHNMHLWLLISTTFYMIMQVVTLNDINGTSKSTEIEHSCPSRNMKRYNTFKDSGELLL